MKTIHSILVIALVLGLAATAQGAEVGKAAPAFTLTDVTGTEHSLADFAGKIVVLEWTNHGCPFVRKHYASGNMQRLQKTYTGKGVVWLTICSSGRGKQGYLTDEQWQKKLEDVGSAASATLADPDGTVGRAYGASATPNMFVIDAKGILVYAGAIDSDSSFKPASIATATNYVAETVDALLAGETVEPKSTRPYGCGVKYAR